MTDLDAAQAVVLLKHLVHAHQKFDQRKNAHTKLNTQLHKVRQASAAHAPQQNIGKEMDVLEQHIAEVLATEKQLISRQQLELAFSTLLGRKIQELDVKLTPRHHRRAANKKKKKTAAKQKTSTESAKKDLRALRKRLGELKKMGTFDKKEIAHLQKKILTLKEKLNVARH